MRNHLLRGSLLSASIAFVVLVLGAALMTLNPGGLTVGIRDAEQQLLTRLQPGVNAPAPGGDLIAMPPSNFDTGVWASNAAAVWPELLFFLIAGGLVVYLLARFRPLWAGLFSLLAIAAALAGSWYLFARGQAFVEVFLPVFFLALATTLGAVLHRSSQPRVVGAPVRTDGHSATLVEQPAAATPAEPRIAPQSRTVTVLAGHLQGLTAGGDTLDPTGAVTLLESGMGPIIAAIHQQHGTVAYVSGSRFAAVWNAFDADAEHAVHACEAALRMVSGLTQQKDRHGESTPYDPLQLAIGIATGPVIIGSIANGYDSCPVVGPCVDVAELLASLALRYGPAAIVSEETRERADEGFALLEIDTIAGPPDGRAMRIFGLYGNPLVRASPKFRALATFHEHLFQAIRGQRWADAKTLIGQCNNLSGAIPQLYDLHLARIGWYESHPLPADWDGAFRPPLL